MAESRIEARHRRAVKARHGMAYKFVSPGRRGVPDRLVLLPITYAAAALMDYVNERIDLENDPTSLGGHIDARAAYREAQRIIAAAVRFAEVKDTGKKPEAYQVREHNRLRAMGFRVDVPDSYETAEKAAEG